MAPGQVCPICEKSVHSMVALTSHLEIGHDADPHVVLGIRRKRPLRPLVQAAARPLRHLVAVVVMVVMVLGGAWINENVKPADAESSVPRMVPSVSDARS